jgi:hypothetical protein
MQWQEGYEMDITSHICEGCGARNSIRKTSKKDWKNFYSVRSIEAKKTSIISN